MKSVKVDTTALGVVSGQIRDDTTQLRKDTEQILNEMNRLRLGFGSHPLGDQANQDRIDIIERYLDSLTNYAETVVDSFDDHDSGSPPRSASPGGETVMMPRSDQGSTTPIPRSRDADVEPDTNGVPQKLDPQPERGGVGDVLPCDVACEEEGESSIKHGGDDLDSDPESYPDPDLDSDPDDYPGRDVDYDPDDYQERDPGRDVDYDPDPDLDYNPDDDEDPYANDDPDDYDAAMCREAGWSPPTPQPNLPSTSHIPKEPAPSQQASTRNPVDYTVITALIIGPRRHGKSSFINRLIQFPRQPTRDRIQPTAVLDQVMVYGADVSTSGSQLLSLDTCDTFRHTEAVKASNRPLLSFEMGLIDPTAPRVKLRLVKADFDFSLDGTEMVESMGRLLASLGKLRQIDESWDGVFDAVALVHKAGPDISGDCQRVFRYFEATMPRLFSEPSVVNTRTPNLAVATRGPIRDARIKELGSLFSTMKNPAHFFFESFSPEPFLAQEFLACTEIATLLSRWYSRRTSGVPLNLRIQDMQLVKTPEMRRTDSLLARLLRETALGLRAEITRQKTLCAQQEEEVANAEVRLKSLIMELNEGNAAVAKYGNTKITLHESILGPSTFTIRGALSRTFKKRGQMTMTEPYDDFSVDWVESTGVTWLGVGSFDRRKRTWKRYYEISDPFAEVRATSFISESQMRRKEIEEWTIIKMHVEIDIVAQRKRVEEKKKELDKSRAKERSLEPNERRAQAAFRWVDELNQEQLPHNKLFTETERRRYAATGLTPKNFPREVAADFMEEKRRERRG